MLRAPDVSQTFKRIAEPHQTNPAVTHPTSHGGLVRPQCAILDRILQILKVLMVVYLRAFTGLRPVRPGVLARLAALPPGPTVCRRCLRRSTNHRLDQVVLFSMNQIRRINIRNLVLFF